MEKYQEYLESELSKAEEKFESVKKEIAEKIIKMQYFTAVDFGAAYAAHIDNLTKAATKIQTLGEVLQVYRYMKGEEN